MNRRGLAVFLAALSVCFLACGTTPTPEPPRPTLRPTFTPRPSTSTPAPVADTAVPITDTPNPVTDTPVAPVDNPVLSTDTPLPATETPTLQTATPAALTETLAPPPETPILPTDTPSPAAGTALPTQTPAPASTALPQPDLVIITVFNSGDREYVEITNRGSAPQSLMGWSVSGSAGQGLYYFPSGYVLLGGATVRLHSGADGVNSPPENIYWTTRTVWNNAGETVWLKDGVGAVVSEYSY